MSPSDRPPDRSEAQASPAPASPSGPARVPLVPRLLLAAFALLLLSWLAFMLHYVLVGSKRQAQPDPVSGPRHAPPATTPDPSPR